MIQIIPAILATTEEQYRKDISKLELSETLQGGWIHIDFADNEFVPNKTIEPEVIEKYPTSFKKEAHLMATHPVELVNRLVEQKFDRILIHVESETARDPNIQIDDLQANLDYIQDHGFHINKEIETGLAIKLGTPLDWLFPYLNDLDVLLIMSIEPGFQGKQFDPKALERIQEVVQVREKEGLSFEIGVDGGVKNSNIKEIVQAGADYAVVGSYLLNGDIEENLEILWEVVNG